MNLYKVITLSFILTLLSVGVVSAQTETNCTPLYGGGRNCTSTGLVIDKKVKHPENNQFVDNLTVNDPKYAPSRAIEFQIAVKNTGTTDFQNVTIADTLPRYLTGVTSTGKFDTTNNTVTYALGSLKAGETKTVKLTAATASQSALPTDQGTTCLTNTARAQAGAIASEDRAAYCIQVLNGVPTSKNGLPVYPESRVGITPKTGPEAIALAALLPGGIAGYLLRKRTK
jgi:uncharacterized repeat protein (TIGR01451 family)